MSLELTVPGKHLVPRRTTDVVGDLIGAFESDTVAVFHRTKPKHESVIVIIIVSMLLLAVALTFIVKLDIVVTSVEGFVMPTAGALYLDPLNPAQVRQVNVKVGQMVKKGQSLATLDPTFTQADLTQMKEHMSSDEAQIAREEAELAKRPYNVSPSNQYEKMQLDLWKERQASYLGSVANFDGQIHSTEAQMSQATSDSEKYTQRLKLASDAENVYVPLLDKGYVSKLQVMQASDTRTEMSRLLADAQNEISQYRETIAALKGQREAYIQSWFSTTAGQLVLDRNDLDLTRDSLDKDQKLQDLTSLDAPEDAIVLAIGKLSPGSIAPGQGIGAVTPGANPLFTLTPLNAPVEMELDVASMDVGFIAVGDTATLKLDAYPYIRFGTAEGVVKSISEGSFTVDQNNTPVPAYFKVRVAVTKILLHNVPPDFRIIPGMTLTGDILVGNRTIMSYLTEGALRTGEEAMREP